jgi:hypothetical protein
LKQTTVEGLEQGYCIIPSDKRFLVLYSFLKRNLNKKIMVFFSSCNSVKYHSELLRCDLYLLSNVFCLMLLKYCNIGVLIILLLLKDGYMICLVELFCSLLVNQSNTTLRPHLYLKNTHTHFELHFFVTLLPVAFQLVTNYSNQVVVQFFKIKIETLNDI